MELIAALPLVGPLLATVLPFLVVLGIVVFVHEFGHYIVGRWCGIGAEVFSIGFGRELFGWTDRRGTRWRVAALPLGGYVKFTGDADVSSSSADPAELAKLSPAERNRSFHLASVERRALTVLAGPAANFLLSIVIFGLIALGQGRPAEGPVIGEISADVNPEFAQALRPGDRIVSVNGREIADFAAMQAALLETDGAQAQATVMRDGAAQSVNVSFRPPARVDGLSPGGAAELAGLQVGDVIVGVDGREIGGFSDLQRATQDGGGQPMTLTVLRDGQTFDTVAAPQMGQATDPVTGEATPRPLLGVQKFSREILPLVEPVGPLSAFAFGAQRTWDVIALSLSGLADVISGREEASEVLGGPIRIAEVSGDAAASGVTVFIGLIAVLSTSIGMINLFPIPVLDGGHLMFYAIEKLRGRPLRERWQEIGNGVGLALVLSLMIFATFNDLSRF